MSSSSSLSSGPKLPIRNRIFISAITNLVGICRSRDGTVNRRLFNLFDRRVPPSPNPTNGVSSCDHIIDPERNLSIRLFAPSNSSTSAPLPLILYFHGGGFVFHSAATGPYDALCRHIATRIPALVASVDYRLAPEHRCPAPYDDGTDALLWLDAAVDLIPDGTPVFIAGDSAGGNIAHHVARRSLNLHIRRLAVAGLVAVQPFFGNEVQTESERRLDGKVAFCNWERFVWLWQSFLPAGANRDHEAANVFGPAGSDENWTGFPATMVVVGGWDALQDHQMVYYEGLKGKGVDVCLIRYPDAIHGFYVFPELSDSATLLDDIAQFVSKHVGGGDNNPNLS